MPLTGEARTKYQREYMRRRRATARQGKGAPSPAPMSGREAELQAALVSERMAAAILRRSSPPSGRAASLRRQRPRQDPKPPGRPSTRKASSAGLRPKSWNCRRGFARRFKSVTALTSFFGGRGCPRRCSTSSDAPCTGTRRRTRRRKAGRRRSRRSTRTSTGMRSGRGANRRAGGRARATATSYCG